jgi:hypothetical protein
MEKPKTEDDDFTESEYMSYKSDLELWEAAQQTFQKAQQDDNFWMVAGGPNAPRNRHKSYELAHNEAKRLAEKQPGTAFYVVRPVDKVLAEPPQAVSTSLTWGTTK